MPTPQRLPRLPSTPQFACPHQQQHQQQHQQHQQQCRSRSDRAGPDATLINAIELDLLAPPPRPPQSAGAAIRGQAHHDPDLSSPQRRPAATSTTIRPPCPSPTIKITTIGEDARGHARSSSPSIDSLLLDASPLSASPASEAETARDHHHYEPERRKSEQELASEAAWRAFWG